MSSILLVAALAGVAGGACGGKTAPPPAGHVTAGSIRAVDWQNRAYDRFTVLDGETELLYDADDNELSPAEWSRRYPRAEPVARGSLRVDAPVYGDVDGDGADDAVVTTTINAGGTGQFSALEVYAMRRGLPVKIAAIRGGDRADGGIAGVAVAANGDVLVERYVNHGGSACCPTATVHEVWRWNGAAVVELERRRSLPFPF